MSMNEVLETRDLTLYDLSPGEIVGVKGIRGRFRVIAAMGRKGLPDTWINLFGGKPGHEMSRSVNPDRITKKKKAASKQ